MIPPNEVVEISSIQEFNEMLEQYQEQLIIISLYTETCPVCKNYAYPFSESQKEFHFTECIGLRPAGYTAVAGHPSSACFFMVYPCFGGEKTSLPHRASLSGRVKETLFLQGYRCFGEGKKLLLQDDPLHLLGHPIPVFFNGFSGLTRLIQGGIGVVQVNKTDLVPFLQG